MQQETQPQEEAQYSDTETTATETTTTTKEEGDGFKIPDITKYKKQSDDVLNLDINTDKILSFYKELTIKELADNTTKKDQILKRIAEHNLKDDTKQIHFYKDKTERQTGDAVELSAIFCDNLILSGLTTTSRIKGKSCADCGNTQQGRGSFTRNGN